MKKFLKAIGDFLDRLECAHTAADLSKRGKYEQVKQLLDKCNKHDT